LKRWLLHKYLKIRTTLPFVYLCNKADCNYHMSSSDTPEYIRISKDLSTIDILLLNQNFRPLNKYLRYVKKDAAYQYLSTVK
ncbi:hypothetical protein VXE39_15000, partial [Acinetobacter junii]